MSKKLQATAEMCLLKDSQVQKLWKKAEEKVDFVFGLPNWTSLSILSSGEEFQRKKIETFFFITFIYYFRVLEIHDFLFF